MKLALIPLLLVGCSPSLFAPDEVTDGDRDVATFAYGGCFSTCGTDRPLALGATERLIVRSDDPRLADADVRTTVPGVLRISPTQTEHGERRFEVEAVGSGSTVLQLVSADSRLIDETSLQVLAPDQVRVRTLNRETRDTEVLITGARLSVGLGKHRRLWAHAVGSSGEALVDGGRFGSIVRWTFQPEGIFAVRNEMPSRMGTNLWIKRLAPGLVSARAETSAGDLSVVIQLD